jgi:hypothetical protein
MADAGPVIPASHHAVEAGGVGPWEIALPIGIP